MTAAGADVALGGVRDTQTRQTDRSTDTWAFGFAGAARHSSWLICSKTLQLLEDLGDRGCMP